MNLPHHENETKLHQKINTAGSILLPNKDKIKLLNP
jgi:hypothetical protein